MLFKGGLVLKIATVVSAGLLFWVIAARTHSYSTPVRLMVFGVAAYGAYFALVYNRIGWAWILGIIAFLFNPLVPIHLDRDTFFLPGPRAKDTPLPEQVSKTIVLPSVKVAKPASVDGMTAYVYESSGEKTVEADLRQEGDRWKGSVKVPAGDNRRVDLIVYSRSLVDWFGSDPDVDVLAGQRTTLDLRMERFVTTLAELGSPDVDGSYSVIWAPVKGASGYMVEESMDRGFSSSDTIYSGRDTSCVIRARDAGTYWYRVMATGSYGKGPWCAPVSVNVGTKEGTIDIEVRWPQEGSSSEEMVMIPAGSFQMGDAFNEGRSDEMPVHTVYVDGFWMDKYKATNREYQKFDPSHNSGSDDWGHTLNADSQPVVSVSWWDAIRYCNWRSRQKGLQVCYNERTGECDFGKNGYRLPTEVEWEYAARGGMKGKRYPWGDNISHDDANFAGIGGKDQWDGSSPVGSFSPNGYGLYDMAGNVFEWCTDWYDPGYYSVSPEWNPTGSQTGTSRVLRTGSWFFDSDLLRCACRTSQAPTSRLVDVGFRCIRRTP